MPRTAAALLLIAASCAAARPTPVRVPPPVPSALEALLAEAVALELGGPLQGRLEAASRALDERTLADRREVEEALSASERPAHRQKAGAGHEGGEPGGQEAGGPGRRGAPGELGGSGGAGPGGRGGGPGRAAERGGGHALVRARLGGLLRQIEDAEMAAYLEVEGWLPEARREACREVVARQRERLLTRHEAIRARLVERE